MAMLGYDRYLSELVAESDRFADAVRAAAPGTAVPTCPGWSVDDLAEHVGRAHRWALAIVARRATIEIPDADVEGDPDHRAPADTGERDAWLRVGARRLAAAIEEAGPHTPVWTWDDADRSAGYWARRMTHETLVHRADASSIGGEPFTVAPDLAADTISEWLEIVVRAVAEAEPREVAVHVPEDPDDLDPGPDPGAFGLRGAGETLRLHAVDEGLGGDGRWLITRTPDGVTWEHPAPDAETTDAETPEAGTPDAPATVEVTGKAVDLMLVMNRRARRTDRDIRLTGDAALLDHWLDHTRY